MISIPGPGFDPWSKNKDSASYSTWPKRKKFRPKCTLHFTINLTKRVQGNHYNNGFTVDFIDEGSESQRQWYNWHPPPGLVPKSELSHPRVLSTV